MAEETNRRRSAVRWTDAPDEGDAAEAVAGIEAWLAAQGPETDWTGVLGDLREAMLRAGLAPRLAGDPAGLALLAALAAEAEDADALDAALDGLVRWAETVPTPPRGTAAGRDDPEGSAAWRARTVFRI